MLYLQTNERFSTYTHLNHDAVVVHDPQPLPLIRFYKKRQPWVWRCHIDLTEPNKKLWDFLKKFILRYDVVIVSSEKYIRKDLPAEYKIITPAIDPLSPKNMELSDTVIKKYLDKNGIPLDKPLITQVSRFDKWKDPEGVLEIFEKVREKVDARLVLCGSMASDDPEGWKIFSRVKERANDMIKKGDVILITIENDILVNALQRVSSVIIQKSKKEGFGLSVTEGMWKGRPVVASNVGGIPLQIDDGVNGFLMEPDDIDGFVDRIVEILKNPEMGDKIGRKAREKVREKFLITRLMQDYLDLFNELFTC